MLKIFLILFLMAISFFFGAFTAVVGSNSLSRKYAKEICVKLLLIAVTISEDIDYIKSTKYHIMRECGYDPNAIKAQKNLDEYQYSKWRTRVIRSIITRYPYPQDLEFNNWNSAIAYLTEYFEQLQPTKEETPSVNKMI